MRLQYNSCVAWQFQVLFHCKKKNHRWIDIYIERSRSRKTIRTFGGWQKGLVKKFINNSIGQQSPSLVIITYNFIQT